MDKKTGDMTICKHPKCKYMVGSPIVDCDMMMNTLKQNIKLCIIKNLSLFIGNYGRSYFVMSRISN